MIDLSTRLSNFLGSVSVIADIQLQHSVWVKCKPGVTAAYSLGELYAQFFDDNEIDDFIENELAHAPLASEQKQLIVRMRDALNDFHGAPTSLNPLEGAELLRDSEWLRIVEIAKATARAFAA